jgi:hypothetical protein
MFDETQLFNQHMSREIQARMAGYSQRWKYFKGDHRRQLKIKPDQPDDNLILNLYRKVVNTGRRFLLADGFTIQLEEMEQTEQETLIDQTLRQNNGMSLWSDTALNGAVCGHCFLKLIPNGTPAGRTRIVNLDPATVMTRWDPEDLTRRLAYKIEYSAVDVTGEKVEIREIHTMEDPAAAASPWKIVKQKRRPRLLARWETEATLTWPWPFPAIIDWQNLPAPNEFYGDPDVSFDGILLQDAINFGGSNLNRIIRYHGHPRTVAKGMKSGDLSLGPDQIAFIPEAADLYNLEIKSDLTAGRLYLADLVAAFLFLNNTPDLDPAKVNVGALSGFALQLLWADMLFITGEKRGTYGAAIEDLTRRLLEIEGKALDPAAEIAIHWTSALPENTTETTTSLQAATAMGVVSKQTAARELGYNYELEQDRMTAEAQQEQDLGTWLLRQFERNQQ